MVQDCLGIASAIFDSDHGNFGPPPSGILSRTVAPGVQCGISDSPCFTSNESKGNINNKSSSFQSGIVVSLVGRATFPCVCEVTKASASLFADESSCIVDQQIRWQSLYMVILGKHMLLAEPEKGGCGGNRRIVTSCLLSCVSVDKDKIGASTSSSPARWLILNHASIHPNSPGVFTTMKKKKKKIH